MTSSKELPPPPPYDAAQYYSSALLKAQRPFAHQSSSHAHHTSATPNPKFTEPDIFEPEKDVPVTSAGVFANVMEYEVYSGKPPHLSQPPPPYFSAAPKVQFEVAPAAATSAIPSHGSQSSASNLFQSVHPPPPPYNPDFVQPQVYQSGYHLDAGFSPTVSVSSGT